MLRASMRRAGAIRLDHVLGLKRLYPVPQGFSARDGVYVQMPFEALLAVTAQESVVNRCVVIGEDLGTVPEGFRDQIADWGIWSYLVMMFERDDAGSFRNIDHYLTNALVTFNTHDLSTYAGWRSFGDLKLKRSLGIDPGESDDARWHALAMLDEVLRHHAIDRNDLYSVANFLARTKSRLPPVSWGGPPGCGREPYALVGRNGSIDWLCWPAFDSDACFAALLGTEKHGRWRIAPVGEITGTSRRYWDDTLILQTRFETADGAIDLIDFMPPRGNASDVVRLVRGVRGRVRMHMQIVIRFGFGIDIS